MFLAAALDLSPSWCVEHEPALGSGSLPQVISRFQRSNYGEVNSCVRQWLDSIPVKRKAVILRDPRAIAVSVYNRHPRDVQQRLHGAWRLLDDYAARYKVFRFEEFTQSADCLMEVAEWAGIGDLQLPSHIITTPINRTIRRVAEGYHEIPRTIRSEIDRDIEWFAAKYY